MSLLTGPPGTGCGVGGKALCIASTCAGGTRDGRLCDMSGKLGCPGGGTCKNLRSHVELTGDEAGFHSPRLGGVA